MFDWIKLNVADQTQNKEEAIWQFLIKRLPNTKADSQKQLNNFQKCSSVKYNLNIFKMVVEYAEINVDAKLLINNLFFHYNIVENFLPKE